MAKLAPRAAIVEAATEIDRAFADAGSQLGEGLAVIGAHGRSLAEMSAALSDARFEEARLALAGVAGEMAETKVKFAAETASLVKLAAHSRRVGQLFHQLARNMRVVTIVTRSARIEGASVAQASSDFGAFTDEIVSLTGRASETVEACLRDQEALRSSLESTLAAQHEFERRFSASLSTVSARILSALEGILRARVRDAEAVGRLADRSERVARASGNAIVTLQSGDNLRQRLEHVIAALDLDCARHPPQAEAALRLIQSEQLSAAAAMLQQDCRKIDSTIGQLAGEASGLVEFVRSVYGGAEGTPLLQDLQAQLAEAADLLRQCEAARQAVDGLVDRLTLLLDRFETTIERLTRTVGAIVLIGINAGLKAARLGGAGRSLVVVAQQLKGTADAIAQDARQLKPVFAGILADSIVLRDRTGQSDRLARLDDGIAAGIEVIQGAGERLAAVLAQIESETDGHLLDVKRARAIFAATAARAETLAAAADELGRGPKGVGRGLDDASAARVRSFLLGEVRSRYSMSAEREIFDRVLHEQGLATEAPKAAPVEEAFCLFA